LREEGENIDLIDGLFHEGESHPPKEGSNEQEQEANQPFRPIQPSRIDQVLHPKSLQQTLSPKFLSGVH